MKTQELHENLQKAIEARDAWQSIAMKKMEMVADLQVTLQNMVTHDAPCFSSTLPQSEEVKVGESSCVRPFLPCKLCHYLSACMVFLPCRHLCVCKLCDFSVSACPVCNAEKVQSIEVLLGNWIDVWMLERNLIVFVLGWVPSKNIVMDICVWFANLHFVCSFSWQSRNISKI